MNRTPIRDATVPLTVLLFLVAAIAWYGGYSNAPRKYVYVFEGGNVTTTEQLSDADLENIRAAWSAEWGTEK